MHAREYLFGYRFDGREYAISIKAHSPAEAEARIKALAWAHYLGPCDAVFMPQNGWDLFKFYILNLLAWIFGWRVKR